MTVAHSEAIPNPIFIGGLYKSGTSLLRALLDRHPNIASGLETYWFELDLPIGGGDSDQDRRKAHIERLARFFEVEEPVVRHWAREADSAERFLDTFLGHLAHSLGKGRWAEKTPGNILHTDRIFRAWPSATVIHIVRRPLDVFASLKQAGKRDTIEEFVALWVDYLGAGRTGLRTHGPDRVVEVRYEALVSDPEKTMRYLLRQLGEDWHPVVSRYWGQLEDYEKVKRVTGKASTTLKRLGQPISTERVSIWRDTVSQAEAERIRDRIAASGLVDLFDELSAE